MSIALNHIKNINSSYGKNDSIQLPNGIFSKLSNYRDGDGKKLSSSHLSFAYVYLITITILYRHCQFVNPYTKTYIQNSDIKEVLGYSRSNKTINYIIKDGGLLDQLELTETDTEIPLSFDSNSKRFIMLSDLHNDIQDEYRSFIKNRNYRVKVPNIIYQYDDDLGSIFDYGRTHKVHSSEIIKFLDEGKDLTYITMYFYLKSMISGMKGNRRAIPLGRIDSDLGFSSKVLYGRINELINDGLIKRISGHWNDKDKNLGASSIYEFIGLSERLDE